MNFDQIGVVSDLHWGTGASGDVANYAGAQAVFDAMFDARPRIEVFAILGDWFDFWRNPRGYQAVLAFNEGRLRALAQRLRQDRRFLMYLLGNHDWVNAGQLARDLAAWGLDSDVMNIATGSVPLGEWQGEHGNRFDAFCNPKSPLFWIGRGVTAAAGLYERITSRPSSAEKQATLDALSPQARGEAALAQIHEKAVQWAVKNSARLVYGHTHRLDALHDPFRGYSVCNSGCCSKDRASWALLLPGGEAVPHQVQGVF